MTTLTLDVIRQAALLLDEAKPLPQLFSWSRWPDGDAVVIEHEEGQRILANPNFWARIPTALTATSATVLQDLPGYMGLQIVNLDRPSQQLRLRELLMDMAERLGSCDFIDQIRPNTPLTDQPETR